ncbi:hypothetical protein [Loigolactobacillus bifermentans]|jgi:uncharacterized membrane protein|uniref:hypothetical protein n=1 Tax=Loigolactobacillus bifermentans TaxID=1607 RepID=UPI0007106808|nr:hypothetical protein [Loigolactobacillus bifermentans]QGG59910.1 hypothetical protein LB003_05250 [Loigolactobacillus bifermentans]
MQRKRTGSVLITAVLFLACSLLLLGGYLTYYRQQMLNLQLVQEYYQVCALKEITQLRWLKHPKQVNFRYNIGDVQLSEHEFLIRLKGSQHQYREPQQLLESEKKALEKRKGVR